MLDSYYKQAKEREQIGVVPKPLSASDVEELIAVLQDPGAESREELLNLIENRIPPGVDEAAKVKAAFLNDLATGRKTCDSFSNRPGPVQFAIDNSVRMKYSQKTNTAVFEHVFEHVEQKCTKMEMK